MFPPLAVLASWVYALLSYLNTLIVSNSPYNVRTGPFSFSSYFLQETISLFSFGTIVSVFFLIYLGCEYRRTPVEVRKRISIRGAYLSAVLLMLGCIVLWDGGSLALALYLK